MTEDERELPGLPLSDRIKEAYERGKAEGRREAVEEAAALVEKHNNWDRPATGCRVAIQFIAKRIRALIDQPEEEGDG